MPGWLSRNNFVAGEAMSHAYLNNLANDIRAWGGGVNAGGYAVANLANITGASGKLGVGTPAPAASVDIYGGGTLWKNIPAYELFASSDRIIQVRGAAQAAVNLVSDANTDGATLGGVYFARSAGQLDAHVSVAGLRAIQDGTGVIAGSALSFIYKGAGAPVEGARLNRYGFGIGTSPATPLHVFGQLSGECARFQGRIDAANQRQFVTIYSGHPEYWWELSVEDASGGGSTNGLALRERSASGSSVVRAYFPQGGGVTLVGLSTYATVGDAMTAGLTAGRVFRTASGNLMVV